MIAGDITGIDPSKVNSIKTDLVNLSNNPQKLDPPFILFPLIYKISEKYLMHIQIPVSSQVHKSASHVYDRSNDGDFKIIQPNRIAELYNRKKTHYTEGTIYPFLKLDDLDADIFPKVRTLIRNNNPNHPWLSLKLIALGFLVVALIGVKGKKDEKQNFKTAFLYLLTGLFFFFTSYLVLLVKAKMEMIATLYIGITGLGYLLFLSGGAMASRIIRDKLSNDIFNRENETFPQEERLLENEYSVNLPMRYQLKGRYRNGWLNLINPFRSVLVTGGAGAGKSYFVIRHIITQHISKGFAMMAYDFKFDDLSKIVYNTFLKYRHLYPPKTQCYFINFDWLLNRCNPLEPDSMLDITDAVESARTILIGLNREWNKRQGAFSWNRRLTC